MDATSISSLAALTGAPVDAAQLPHISPEQRAQIQSVKAAAKVVNDVRPFGENSELTFFLDRNSRQAVVRIVDRSTGEVLQQIPNEQVLRMAEEYRNDSRGK